MQKKRIIIGIIIAIVLITLGDILLVYWNKSKQSVEENIPNKKTEESKLAEYYLCTGETKSFEGIMNNQMMTFTYQNGYSFSWGNNGLENGHRIMKITFANKSSYDGYVLTSENTNTEPEIEENPESLTKTYSFCAMIPSEDNHLENYLKILQEQGLNCEKGL